MPLDQLKLDYETFSEVNLLEVGSYNYATHPSTEVLMAEFSINGSREQWVPAEGAAMPAIFREAMVDPEVQKWAWNSSFEMVISQHVLGLNIQIPQWRDTMILSHYCGFPGQLEVAGPALGIPKELCKDPEGKRLMKRFSMMQTSQKKATKGQKFRIHWWEDLERWDHYLQYNRRDVEIETRIFDLLIPFDLPEWEWEYWHLDQKINQAGLPINLAMVNNAVALFDKAYARGLAEMNEITGLDNSMSTKQLLPWMNGNGYLFEDCKKGHIRQAHGYFDEKPDHWEQDEWIGYSSNADLKRVLELRLELSRSSIKKFHALKLATPADGNLRNTLQFMGASRTGRWAGRVFQPQNLPRPEKKYEKEIELHAAHVAKCTLEDLDMLYGNVFDVLASCIRPAAQAPEGFMFVDCDLNAIENRVLGWLAGCPKILNVFEAGRDPYVDFATYLFNRPYDELWNEYKAGDSKARTIAKPGVLGCGYMLGAGKTYENKTTGEIEATGLLGYAWDMGIRQFTFEESKLSVDTFRREFKEVKDYWYAIERAAIRCVETGIAQGCGHVTFDLKGDFLRMKLPSNRYLHYYKPKMQRTQMPWKNPDGTPATKMSLTYMGQDPTTKQWKRMSTHPGKLTENADQAISRDLLVHGMGLAADQGLDIRLHVHDQILPLVREEEADDALVLLSQCMEVTPEWAKGLPLGSAGFKSKVFKKD